MLKAICRSDMGKEDKYRGMYDPVATMQNVPALLGMELVKHGQGLQGGYYLNGDRHAYRRDKLKVFISRGCIWVSEEGGRCVSLPQWLVEFGGASDFKDALKIINGKPQAIEWTREFREVVTPKKELYVSPDVVAGLKSYDLRKCNLFNWMCSMFPEERVREVWDRYNACTDSHGNAVYLYTDQKGHVLFDKRIAYKEDGKRDRNFFPGRQFRVADGYTGKCYYGANLADDGKKAFIMESEKSVLLSSLYYGDRRFLATGGKSNLREIEPNMLLVPDMDARDSWLEKSSPEQIWPWWEKAGMPVEQIPEHWDIGDLIAYRMLQNKK